MQNFRNAFFALLLFLSGCAVGPNYQAPVVVLPSHYIEEGKQEKMELSSLKSWWTQFNDPLLNILIHEAIRENFDLKIAIAKVNQVRELYFEQAAELFPKVDVVGAAERSKISETIAGSPFLGPPFQNFFRSGFDASWELDLFGKLRREKEAAFYSLEAERESARGVYITLLSEVASNYIAARGLQEKIALTKKSVYIQKELLSLSSIRFDAGLASEIEEEGRLASLENTSSTLPSLETALKQTLYRLAILLGKTPEGIQGEFDERKNIPLSYQTIPVNLPSELLRRRPDIRKAERVLAQETALLGSTIADLFPRFFLLGSYEMQSSRLHNLTKPASRAWTFGPTFNWPLLYFGRIRASIRAQAAVQEQALLNYEQTILDSLRDVESTLSAYHEEKYRHCHLSNEVSANRRAYELTRDLYLSGLKNFSDLLQADQTLLNSENALTDSTQTLSTNLVAVYKALGGEW